MPYNFPVPTWRQMGELYQQIIQLHQENALKLKQILDLEEILLATATMKLDDESPCWCCLSIVTGDAVHENFCIRAREATKHLWSLK